MALLYFQALACSGDEQLSNTLRKTYVACSNSAEYSCSGYKVYRRVELAETERLGNETTI